MMVNKQTDETKLKPKKNNFSFGTISIDKLMQKVKLSKKSKYLKKESYNTKPMCKRKTNLRCPGNRT